MQTPAVLQLALLGLAGNDYADSVDMAIVARLRSLAPRVVSVVVDVIDGDVPAALHRPQNAE
jgi:hypothetical protein